jgi:hypothetical protein
VISREFGSRQEAFALQAVCKPLASAAELAGLWCASGKYLVDPASSHMLVSKIKPCMSKHMPINGKAANGSLQQL